MEKVASKVAEKLAVGASFDWPTLAAEPLELAEKLDPSPIFEPLELVEKAAPLPVLVIAEPLAVDAETMPAPARLNRLPMLFSPNLAAVALGLVLAYFLWLIVAAVGPALADGLARVVSASMAAGAEAVAFLVKGLAFLFFGWVFLAVVSSLFETGNVRPPKRLPAEARRRADRTGNETGSPIIVNLNVNAGGSQTVAQ